MRAPTPRERRMSRERAAEAEARRNSEALRDEAAADLSDLSDGDDATVVEARPTARRRVRARVHLPPHPRVGTIPLEPELVAGGVVARTAVWGAERRARPLRLPRGAAACGGGART